MRLLLALAAALLFAACGSPVPAPAPAPVPVSAHLLTTGGVAGIREEVDVRADGTDSAPLSGELRRRLWSIVGTNEFRRLRLPSDSLECSDSFTHDLTVRYADGTATEYEFRSTCGRQLTGDLGEVLAILNQARR